MRYTLGKSEKLRHTTLVEGVFAEGRKIYDFPLRVMYRIVDEAELRSSFRDHVPDRIGPLQMMITVPKKKRRHAVDRVLMRRRIREAYRLNRLPLFEKVRESDGRVRSVEMAFIYLHNENTGYSLIDKKMKRIIAKIAREIENNTLPEGES